MLVERSTAGSLACGVLWPELRWSHQHDAVALRIEPAAKARRTPTSRTTVQHDRGLAVGVARDAPRDAVPVPDVEHALVVRVGGGGEVHGATVPDLRWARWPGWRNRQTQRA